MADVVDVTESPDNFSLSSYHTYDEVSFGLIIIIIIILTRSRRRLSRGHSVALINISLARVVVRLLRGEPMGFMRCLFMLWLDF